MRGAIMTNTEKANKVLDDAIAGAKKMYGENFPPNFVYGWLTQTIADLMNGLEVKKAEILKLEKGAS